MQKLIIAMQNRLRSPILTMPNYRSPSVADFDDAKLILAMQNRLPVADFGRCKTYYSDAKSTSVADFDDAKLVLAMNNRLRWPILTMQNFLSPSVADFDDAKLSFSDAIIDFGGRFWRWKIYFSDEKSTSVADFDDVLAMNNRLRWTIDFGGRFWRCKTNYSDAKSTSVADLAMQNLF